MTPAAARPGVPQGPAALLSLRASGFPKPAAGRSRPARAARLGRGRSLRNAWPTRAGGRAGEFPSD